MRMFFPIALAAICCAPMLTACDSREGETVESAYVLPPYPDPSYAFKRNGTSSVDYLECRANRSTIFTKVTCAVRM